MKLNKGKCEALKFGGTAAIRFHNKELVKEVQKAKYLGCILSKTNDTEMEVRGRIREAMSILKKMHAFWRHSNCNLRFKITVMQAVLYSKILFGLESAELTTGALRSLDTFQLKCLRKILKIKTTFVDRANTNESVYKRASEQLKNGEEIVALSQVYLNRKQGFYCQVASVPGNDPTRMVTFEHGTTKPIQHLPRRRGRPKVKWAHTEAKRIWKSLKVGNGPWPPYDPRSDVQENQIMLKARELNRKRKR